MDSDINLVQTADKDKDGWLVSTVQTCSQKIQSVQEWSGGAAMVLKTLISSVECFAHVLPEIIDGIMITTATHNRGELWEVLMLPRMNSDSTLSHS